MKVSATPTALELIEDLKKTHGKDLLFHQSGGCCDGSAPMCYPAKEYLVGDQDVLVGEIGGIPFYISKTQHEAWKNTDLIIDCIKGMGGMFSLDNGTGRKHSTHSFNTINYKISIFPSFVLSFANIKRYTAYLSNKNILITN